MRLCFIVHAYRENRSRAKHASVTAASVTRSGVNANRMAESQFGLGSIEGFTMLSKIKFALAAGLTVVLTTAAAAMVDEDPANKIDHRYPYLAVAQQPKHAGLAAFAHAQAPLKAGSLVRDEKVWFDRATGRVW